MRFRITIILMLAIGGLTALAAGTVLFVSAGASIRNTLELMRARAQLTISALEQGVSGHVAPAQHLIVGITGRIARSSLDINDRDRLEATLVGALAPAPQIGGVVIWGRDGDGLWVTRRPNGQIAIDRERSGDEPGFRSFINENAEAGGINWGTPYYREGATYITMTGVIVRNGVYGGTVATGVSLVELSRFVSDLAQEGMTAFILYGDDKVLAHPAMLQPEYSGRLSAGKPLLSVEEIDDPVLARFAALNIADLPGEDAFEVREPGSEGGSLIISAPSRAFGAVPWNIGVHVPVDAVNQQVRRLTGSIVLSLGLLVVSVAAALLLARRIARPLSAVSAAAERIEHLDLDGLEPLPSSRIRELDEQARSFNRMVQGLRWFQAYVPQTLVRRLMQATEGPATEVREAELTVMFTDIVGFTTLSEHRPAAEVAAILNRHFELLNACIEAEDGTLDKFIGDATMAFWGAPEAIADHAARACRAALAIARAIETQKGETPPIRVKIALHTGPLIVGNIGASSRMNYTVIGDTVNVCARIESLASDFDDGRPSSILVSGEVVHAAGDSFTFEPLGERVVKGRARAVEIWRLTGEAG
jgi:adenylate cyclase